MNIKEINFAEFKQSFLEIFSKVSAETVGWFAIVILHCATLPSLLAIMKGLTDTMLPVDMVLLVWAGLTLLFIKAAVQKDMLNLITIGVGFIAQAALMALIFFK